MSTKTVKPFTTGKWIKATFWGWLLGIILLIMLSSILDGMGIENMQFYIGIGMGAGVGLTQWLLLKRYRAINASWIWASLLGMGMPFVILDFIMPHTVKYKLPLSVALGGLLVGVFQYLVLKKQFQRSSVWILTSLAGWTIAAVIVLAIDLTMKIKVAGSLTLVLALVNLLIMLLGGVALGLITGGTMKKILYNEMLQHERW
jgi:hypothetical protein